MNLYVLRNKDNVVLEWRIDQPGLTGEQLRQRDASFFLSEGDTLHSVEIRHDGHSPKEAADCIDILHGLKRMGRENTHAKAIDSGVCLLLELAMKLRQVC